MIGLERNYAQRSEALDEQGFVIWKDLFTDELIEGHVAPFDLLDRQLGNGTAEEFVNFPGEKKRRIHEAHEQFHREHKPTQALVFNEQLMSFFRWRFRAEPALGALTTGRYHRRTPPHTDCFYMRPDPPEAAVRVWIALEDISPDSGPMYFVPASHRNIGSTLEQDVCEEKLEVRTILNTLVSPTSAIDFSVAFSPICQVAQNVIERSVKESGSSKVIPRLSKGDAILFRLDVVHGTAPCVNDSLTRMHLICSWSATSCSWYHARAFWDPQFEYRYPENAVQFKTEQTEFGSRIMDWDDSIKRSLTSKVCKRCRDAH